MTVEQFNQKRLQNAIVSVKLPAEMTTFIRKSKVNRQSTSFDLQKYLSNSGFTVRRRYLDDGRKTYRPQKKQYLRNTNEGKLD